MYVDPVFIYKAGEYYIMLTKIDLCSMALLKLGEKPIQSLLDDTAAAQLARTLFDPITDALIAVHPWRFATKKFELSKTADGDFLIPSECLRVTHTGGNAIVGNRITAQPDRITIIGLTRVAPDAYPAYFASLVATKLAMEFCVPLTGDQTIFRTLAALYDAELQSAKFIDSTTTSVAGIENFSLINARF